MLFEHHHFHFFEKRGELNSLYITTGLLHFAEGLINVFVPVYFWGLGFPFWKILFFYFLVAFSFLILTPVLLPLIRKLSDKMLMALGLPFLVLYYFGLGFIVEAPILFYLLPIAHSLFAVLFYIGYHLDFASAVKDDHIGKKAGIRLLIVALAQFAAPFVGGLLIASWGFHYIFIISGSVMLFSIVPLFFFPRRTVSPNLRVGPVLGFLRNKHLLPFNLSGVGYATETIIGGIVWGLFVFLSVGSIQKFGGVISISLLGSLLAIYFAGFLSDVGRRRKLITFMTILLSMVYITRPLLASFGVIVASEVAGRITHSAFLTAWSSQYYKLARAVSDRGLFVLSREVLYNISRVVFIPILMLCSVLFSINTFFVVSFLIGAGLVLLFFFANKQHRKDLHDGFLA